MPSGSMGNLASIMAQAERGQEVICEAAGHIYNYEMASMSALGGVLPRVIPAQDGILSWEQIAPAIREKAYYRPQTALRRFGKYSQHGRRDGLSDGPCERNLR